MEKKKQRLIITEAFAADIPSNKEDWPAYYRERMDICAKCDKNTANGGSGAIWKFAASKIGAQCGICHCFIDRKCWSKNEACGLSEIEGGIPKWNRILMETSFSDLFDVENLSFDKYNLDLSKDGHEFDLNLGTIQSDDDVVVAFRVMPKDKLLQFKSVSMCSCMRFATRTQKDNIMDIKINLNTPISVGAYNKLAVVDYTYPDVADDQGNPITRSCLVRILANVVESNNN